MTWFKITQKICKLKAFVTCMAFDYTQEGKEPNVEYNQNHGYFCPNSDCIGRASLRPLLDPFLFSSMTKNNCLLEANVETEKFRIIFCRDLSQRFLAYLRNLSTKTEIAEAALVESNSNFFVVLKVETRSGTVHCGWASEASETTLYFCRNHPPLLLSHKALLRRY